jgi:CoA-ligase
MLCLDLGEEQYMKDHRHPVIDTHARAAHIDRETADPATAVILLDVVLGHGSYPDPAAALAPRARGTGRAGSAVVAYVLGAEVDPQDRARREGTLAEAGCILGPDRRAGRPAGRRDRRPGGRDRWRSTMTRLRRASPPPQATWPTYSTKPRGGVVHCPELADALHRNGCRLHVFSVGDPGERFF